MIKMKETIKYEINNQAQAEYIEKCQKDMEKSMKEMCERVNNREQEEEPFSSLAGLIKTSQYENLFRKRGIK